MVFSFYQTYFIMKICIIFCVPVHILHLAKIVSTIWAKMVSANQVAVFLRELYITRTNWRNNMIFCMLKQSWFKIFWVGMVINGCGQSDRGGLKLPVSQEWVDGINWFFAWYYKFRRAKSCFSDFWLGVVKSYLRPQNLLYLKNEFKIWADFLHADSNAGFWLSWYSSVSSTFGCRGSIEVVVVFLLALSDTWNRIKSKVYCLSKCCFVAYTVKDM